VTQSLWNKENAPLVEVDEDDLEGSVQSLVRSNSTRSTGSNYSAGSDSCILCSKEISAFGEAADLQALVCGHIFHKECSENWMRLLSERHMTRKCPECSHPHE